MSGCEAKRVGGPGVRRRRRRLTPRRRSLGRSRRVTAHASPARAFVGSIRASSSSPGRGRDPCLERLLEAQRSPLLFPKAPLSLPLPPDSGRGPPHQI